MRGSTGREEGGIADCGRCASRLAWLGVGVGSTSKSELGLELGLGSGLGLGLGLGLRLACRHSAVVRCADAVSWAGVGQ